MGRKHHAEARVKRWLEQTLPASAFDWRVVIEHCPTGCHDHVMQSFPDRTSGSFTAPDHDYPSSLRIELTVTDAGGLTEFEEVTIDPRTVQLSVNPNPVPLNADGRPATGAIFLSSGGYDCIVFDADDVELYAVSGFEDIGLRPLMGLWQGAAGPGEAAHFAD